MELTVGLPFHVLVCLAPPMYPLLVLKPMVDPALLALSSSLSLLFSMLVVMGSPLFLWRCLAPSPMEVLGRL